MKLYDASAFFKHLQKNKLNRKHFILDITIYEIGNVIWKYVTKLKKISKQDAEKITQPLILWDRIIRIESNDEIKIMKISLSTKLTYYDSAYIYFSKKFGMELLTCDKKMFKTAKKMKINVKLV